MGSPPEDAEEFRRAVAGAEPLSHRKKVVQRRPAPPVPRQRLRDEQAALAESLGPLSLDDALEAGNELVYLREGYSRDVLRKLRRGHWVVEEELDLHGMNRHVAAVSVADFMRHCRKRGRRCVRIIHGKGMRSGPRGPVLKQTVNTLLRRAGAVLAFASARARDGGTGATLVLLGKG